MPVPLYIDHSADPRHDGYAIQTTERAIKQTTAFSRYKVALAPSRAPTLTLTHTPTPHPHTSHTSPQPGPQPEPEPES